MPASETGPSLPSIGIHAPAILDRTPGSSSFVRRADALKRSSYRPLLHPELVAVERPVDSVGDVAARIQHRGGALEKAACLEPAVAKRTALSANMS